MNAEINLSSTILSTNRLLLRPFQKDDFPVFFSYSKKENVAKIAGFPVLRDENLARQVFQQALESRNSLSIYHKDDNRIIGSISLETLSQVKYVQNMKAGREISFVLDDDYWGHEYMPEALNALLDYLFRQHLLDFVICCHRKENQRSKRVIEKCGFSYVFESLFKDGEGNLQPIECYYLDKKE